MQREPETVTAAGWSCVARPGPYGVAVNCTFDESDANFATVIHCESQSVVHLRGEGDARATVSAICARADGTCFENQFQLLGSQSNVACPRPPSGGR